MKENMENFYTEDEAREEAGLMREKVESGEAENYDHAEELAEKELRELTEEDKTYLQNVMERNKKVKILADEYINKLKQDIETTNPEEFQKEIVDTVFNLMRTADYGSGIDNYEINVFVFEIKRLLNKKHLDAKLNKKADKAIDFCTSSTREFLRNQESFKVDEDVLNDHIGKKPKEILKELEDNEEYYFTKEEVQEIAYAKNTMIGVRADNAIYPNAREHFNELESVDKRSLKATVHVLGNMASQVSGDLDMIQMLQEKQLKKREK